MAVQLYKFTESFLSIQMNYVICELYFNKVIKNWNDVCPSVPNILIFVCLFDFI